MWKAHSVIYTAQEKLNRRNQTGHDDFTKSTIGAFHDTRIRNAELSRLELRPRYEFPERRSQQGANISSVNKPVLQGIEFT